MAGKKFYGNQTSNSNMASNKDVFTNDVNQQTTEENDEQQHKCSLCLEPFIPNIDPITFEINLKCNECLTTIHSIPSGFPFELVNKVKEYECPICLSLIKDATELPCTHLMCKACLVFYEDGEIRQHKE